MFTIMPRFRKQALLEVVRGGSGKKRNIDIGKGGGPCLTLKKPTWVPPTLWSPLDSPFLPVPDAPAQDLPCPSTRKTLVWASLFLLEFPSATYCPCPETSLSSSGSHWFGHLDSCSLLFISPVWTPLLLPVPGSCRLLQVGHVPAVRATTGKGGQ